MRKAAMYENVAAFLFRPPTGLADGLALKELALPPLQGGIRPNIWFPRSDFPVFPGESGFGVSAG
jgi:hypothetical protein